VKVTDSNTRFTGANTISNPQRVIRRLFSSGHTS